MLAKGHGSIVNICSVVAQKPAANRHVYAATKSAVLGLTPGGGARLDRQGHPLQLQLPRPSDTFLDDRIAALGESVGGAAQARKMFVERQPLGRLGTAEGMEQVAVYLASDEAAFTTGTAVIADGGLP